MKPSPHFDPPLKACPLCASSQIHLLFKDCRDNTIFQCDGCGLQFMNPLYSDKYLQEYYGSYVETDSAHVSEWDEPLLYGHDYYLQLVEKYTDAKPDGRFLDIGCGSGHLIDAALRRGWKNVEGQDFDAGSTQAVAKRLNVKVYSGDFTQVDIPENSYKVITAHQVLEHVKNPAVFLEKIDRLLQKNGTLFIAVPNIKSSSNRFKFLLESWGLRQKRRGVYYASDHHLTYFEPAVLRQALENLGFKVVYERNCHKVKPGQSKVGRWISRNITDSLFWNSAFFLIAKKKA